MAALSMGIVIRNRNEAKYLKACFAALRVQTMRDVEVVVVDNESEDESRDLAMAEGARIVTIRREDFTYGRAINAGIRALERDVIVLLSPHSIPLHKDFLESVRAAFVNDCVAGIRCVQATRREEVPEWHRRIELKKGATVQEILQWGLNATCCAIRRRVWEEVKFDEGIEAAEDKLWTREVLRRGYEVHRIPALYGYIKQSSSGTAVVRNYREALGAYRAFGVAPRYTILGPLSAMTLGGLRRYWGDVVRSWRSYLLLRRVEKDAKLKPRQGSLW